MDKINILAIETSCDETAASIVRAQKTDGGFELKVLSNIVASQIDLHKKWGGVWPELASRAHLEAMIPTLQATLEPLEQTQSSNLKTQNYRSEPNNCHAELDSASRNTELRIESAMTSVDAIAATTGPGLIGSLLMGVETAQILGAHFHKPVIEVNHLEGHIYSAFCTLNQRSNLKNQNDNSKFKISRTNIFPVLASVVSGGHTSLILMDKHLSYRTVGQTIDDAAGEAFDKVARILDLGYPGGPAIEKFAVGGNENAYDLPLSMIGSKDLNFSFSGLKTAVLYLTKNPATGEPRKFNKKDLAASFQRTVCEILTRKTISAIKKYHPRTVILSGGVSANSYLREKLTREVSSIEYQVSAKNDQPCTKDRRPTVLIPPRELSTDNAVGIGIVGALRALEGQGTSWKNISARANFMIDKI